MSNPTSSHGEPVEEPTAVDDDIVVRAQEGLADAEAARVEEHVVVKEPAVAQEPDPWDSPEAATLAYEPAAEAETTVYEPVVTPSDPVVTPSEPVVEAPVVAAAPILPGPSPIFVQAPESPRPRGNRAAAGAIGLLAAVSFAVLYLATALGFGAIQGTVTAENVGSAALTALGTWGLWVPTVVFFIAFWLLGAIINRGRWGVWVVTGLLVGVAAYGGHILGQLFEAPFWTLTASQGQTLVEGQLLAPLAIAAFVFGRELTIWFGAWAAARGRRVTELNVEAQREYERTLEAGPQLVRA
ncbi:ABC transporter [Microbacterium sp.]|uniref:ABC transporter n=1 Tax=Microbacterium sp. TaxID=51671 RepID=UPI003F7306E9